MDRPFENDKAEELLANASWLRGLARSLVRHDDQIDDLTQETVVAALEQRPNEIQNLKSWMATVMRNIAIRNAIKDRNRTRREIRSAKPELNEQAFETQAQLEQHHQLVELVKSIEEPYRSAVFLRYFENRSPSEIAQRLGIPASTVRTHISRGLDKLRTKLDREYGNRKAWCVALLPLAGLDGSAIPLSVFPIPKWLGGSSAGTNLKLAGVALIVVTVSVLWLVLREEQGRSPSTESAKKESPAKTETLSLDETGAPTRESRTGDVGQVAEISSIGENPITPRLIQCVVTDQYWTGVPDATIEFWQEPNPKPPFVRSTPSFTRTTDGSGRFQFIYPTEATYLIARNEKIGFSLAYGPPQFETGDEWRILLRGRVEVTGLVQEASGAPVAGAEIRLRLPRAFDAPTRAGHQWVPGQSNADADGKFRLDISPFTTHLLWAEQGNNKTNYVLLHNRENAKFEARLVFPGAYSISGSLLSPDGSPVRGARVHAWGLDPAELDFPLDHRSIETDEQGFFRLTPAVPGQYQVLSYTSGFSSSQCETIKLSPERPHAEIQIKLQPGKTISGRILHPADVSATEVGLLAIPDQNDEKRGCYYAAEPSSLLLEAKPRENGEFRFENTIPWQSYSIFLGSKESGYQRLLASDIPAGTSNLEFTISAEMSKPTRVHGRILHANDNPLKGLQLVVAEHLLAISQKPQSAPGKFNTEGTWQRSITARLRMTSKETFEIDGLPFGNKCRIIASAEQYATVEQDWLMDAPEKEVLVRLQRPVNLRCRVLDRNGKPITGLRLSIRKAHASALVSRHSFGTTDEHGLVLFNNLAPGHYLYADSPDAKKGQKFRFANGLEPPHQGELELPEVANATAELIEVE